MRRSAAGREEDRHLLPRLAGPLLGRTSAPASRGLRGAGGLSFFKVQAQDREKQHGIFPGALLDEFFTKVSETQLLRTPGLQPLRLELVESTLKFYEEFLTAIPAHFIPWSYAPGEPYSSLPQHRVSHQMSPGVVNALEVIDVAQEQ